jgi:hypothetical protein
MRIRGNHVSGGLAISGFLAMACASMRTLLLLSLAAPVASLLADGAFYGDPPDSNHPWAIHDMNRPQPTLVKPGTFSSQTEPGVPPSDAVVLFGGKAEEIEKWQADKTPAEATKWVVVDGALQCVPGSGYIRTKEEFSDCQLHVEWTAPTKVEGNSQGRGNSGVFLPGGVEVQVLDNWDNPSYPDGMAGSIYGVNPPAVNPLRAPGEWQSYDIIFRRPVWQGGKLVDPGYLTVFINGVLVQDHTPLEGGGGHKARSKDKAWPEKGPLKLQDHGNPVRYRNIWYRPLAKRFTDGGEYSRMSKEATLKKRAEIAKTVREDAAKKDGVEKALRLLESTVYEANEAATKDAQSILAPIIDAIAKTPADQLESRKGEAMRLFSAYNYLAKGKLISKDDPAVKALSTLVKANEWDKPNKPKAH